MIFGYNEKILSFGSYLANTVSAVTKYYFKLVLTYMLTAVFAALGLGIFVGVFWLVGKSYLPADLIGNPQLILQYTLADFTYLFNALKPVMPALMAGLALCLLFIFFAIDILQCTLYLLADAYIKGVKRSIGSILGYALKRAIPVIGSRIWRGIYFAFYTSIFVLLAYAILWIAEVDTTWTSLTAGGLTNNSGVFYGLLALLAVYIIFMLSLRTKYVFTTFIRMKYKVHGTKSMKLSRRLTKGKRGKIFFNFFFYLIIVGVIFAALGLGIVRARENEMQLTLWVFRVIAVLLSVYIPMFGAIMYANFELARGRYAISALRKLPQCPQDKRFDAQDRRLIALRKGKVPTQEIFAMPPVQSLRKNAQPVREPNDDPLGDKIADVLKPMGIEPDAIGKPEEAMEKSVQQSAGAVTAQPNVVVAAPEAEPEKVEAPPKRERFVVDDAYVASALSEFGEDKKDEGVTEIKEEPIAVRSELEVKRGRLSESLRENIQLEELDDIDDLGE